MSTFVEFREPCVTITVAVCLQFVNTDAGSWKTTAVNHIGWCLRHCLDTILHTQWEILTPRVCFFKDSCRCSGPAECLNPTGELPSPQTPDKPPFPNPGSAPVECWARCPKTEPIEITGACSFHAGCLFHGQTTWTECRITEEQELIRRWDSERELLCSAPGSYLNSLK